MGLRKGGHNEWHQAAWGAPMSYWAARAARSICTAEQHRACG